MKTRHCDECRHQVPFLIAMKCANGHRPRFYAPNSDPSDTEWGYKRKCADFEPKELSK